MTQAAWSLQKAIYQALISHQPLIDLIGAGQVYDDVPRDADFPYVTFGPTASRDWSTGSDDGDEHVVTLNAWSRVGGRRGVLAIAETVRAALDEVPLSVDGHRLINLRHEAIDARRGEDGETYQGSIRLRAVTEPVSG